MIVRLSGYRPAGQLAGNVIEIIQWNYDGKTRKTFYFRTICVFPLNRVEIRRRKIPTSKRRGCGGSDRIHVRSQFVMPLVFLLVWIDGFVPAHHTHIKRVNPDFRVNVKNKQHFNSHKYLINEMKRAISTALMAERKHLLDFHLRLVQKTASVWHCHLLSAALAAATDAVVDIHRGWWRGWCGWWLKVNREHFDLPETEMQNELNKLNSCVPRPKEMYSFANFSYHE